MPPTISFNLGTSNSPESQLWDLNGSYTLNLTVVGNNGTPVPVQLSFTLIHAANGQLTSPSNDIQGLIINGINYFAVTPRASGKVTGSGSTARAHFTVSFHGQGNLGGLSPIAATGSVTVDAEPDPTSGDLVGTKASKFHVSFSNSSSISGTADLETSLPPGVNGSWNLTLQVVPSNPLAGTGTFAIANDTFGLDLGGKLKNGVLNIKAKGAANVPNALNGSGSSATMLLADPFDSIQLNGKLMGQRLTFFFQPSS